MDYWLLFSVLSETLRTLAQLNYIVSYSSVDIFGMYQEYRIYIVSYVEDEFATQSSYTFIGCIETLRAIFKNNPTPN